MTSKYLTGQTLRQGYIYRIIQKQSRRAGGQHIGLLSQQPWKTVGGGNVDSKVVDDAGHEYQRNLQSRFPVRNFAND